jgi:hypothetical protein
MTKTRAEARDRRQSAMHEAGHLVVALHFGVPAHAEIWRIGDPTLDERSWTGQTQMCRYEVRSDRRGRLRSRRIRVTPATKRKIGVAGIIAEAVWQDDLTSPEDLLCDPAAMSPTDWKMAGGAPDEDVGWRIIRAAEEVFGLLARGGPLWGELVTAARQLIVDARTVDEMARL